MRGRWNVWACILAALVYAGVVALVAEQHEEHEQHANPAAQALRNPTPATPASIANGQKVFQKNCVFCHGDTGKGDGMQGEDMDPPPADLTDHEWEHGSTDGEIYTVIRGGTTHGMKAFGSKLTAGQIWDLVNFLRSIGPKPAKSH